MLLEKPGEVVTREDMRQRLWAEDTFVDFEHSLNSAIKKLRTALGDSAVNSRYVETIPRLGYRFVAPVREVLAKTPLAAESTPSAGPPDDRTRVEESPSRRWPILLATSLVLIATVGGYYHWSHSRARPQPSTERLMLAVLPFENLTGDAAQEYFSDGLTEEMIAQVGRTDPQHLGVIARTSVMHYKHTQEQLDQIGRELGVQYVLEGSVRRDADKMRITAELIQMKDQANVWSQQFDRAPDSLLSLQGEIAQEISDAIQLTLGNRKPPENALVAVSPAPKSYEAYDLYLQGRYFWNKRTRDDFYRSVDCFQKAIAKDPAYARAYAGLAASYVLMASYYVAPQAELIPKARAAALKALDLDENQAGAHAALAVIAQNYDWDWQTAEKEFRRAIALDPNYATGHHWYSEHLAFRGRFDESFEEMERARQLDPLSLIIQIDNAVGLYYARQYDRAIAQFRAVGAVEPNFARIDMIAFAYAQQGRFGEALAAVEGRKGSRDPFWTWSEQAYVYGRANRPAMAKQALVKMLQFDRHHRIEPTLFVTAFIGVGDNDQAIAWLEKASAAHSPGLVNLKVDPIYDPLRSDPRFQSLLRRVGLAQ